jgi:hypothetical protein
MKTDKPEFVEICKQMNLALIGNENLKVEIAKIVLGTKSVENSPHLANLLSTLNDHGLALAVSELKIDSGKITDPELAKKLMKSVFTTYMAEGDKSPVNKAGVAKFMDGLAAKNPELVKTVLTEVITEKSIQAPKLIKDLDLANKELVKKDRELSTKIMENLLTGLQVGDLKASDVKATMAKIDPDNSITKQILNKYDEPYTPTEIIRGLGWKLDKFTDVPALAGKFVGYKFMDFQLHPKNRTAILADLKKDLEIIKNSENKNELAKRVLYALEYNNTKVDTFQKYLEDPALKPILEELMQNFHE